MPYIVLLKAERRGAQTPNCSKLATELNSEVWMEQNAKRGTSRPPRPEMRDHGTIFMPFITIYYQSLYTPYTAVIHDTALYADPLLLFQKLPTRVPIARICRHHVRLLGT